jgi:RNA polymerase sigma-70 factor (ECF subfamily)
MVPGKRYCNVVHDKPSPDDRDHFAVIHPPRHADSDLPRDPTARCGIILKALHGDGMRQSGAGFPSIWKKFLFVGSGVIDDNRRLSGTPFGLQASHVRNRRMSSDMDFATVVDRHYGSLYRFAFSLTCSEADACDLVQETFYIWLKKSGQIREPCRVKSWLFTTLHRAFLQIRRRGTRFPHVELSGVESELPVVDETNWNRLDSREISGFFHRIDEVFRAPLALFYLEDLSYEQISQSLELPLGTVKSRLSRGVAQLRELLSHDIRAGKGEADE